MQFRIDPDEFVLLGLPPESVSTVLPRLKTKGQSLGQAVWEKDVFTLFLPSESDLSFLSDYAGAKVDRGYRLITFTAPMEWDVVGFLAQITGALAANEIPLGAVCGYFRDHIFVKEKYLEQAAEALRQILPEHQDL